MVSVIDEISYIVDLCRSRGEITLPNGSLPCSYVVSCYPCTPLSELEDGTYKTHSEVPYFYYGTKKEILARLTDKNQASLFKYPAIILEMPIRETLPTDNRTNAEVNLFFVTSREASMTYAESYEANIKPTLYPLIETFIIKMTTSESVFGSEVIEKIEAPNYGDGGKMASDYWDAVMLKIKFILKSNCKKLTLCQT
jgi:hypothetical protein